MSPDHSIPDHPARPAEIGEDVPLRDLANHYHRHTWALLAHHYDRRPVTAPGVAEHCLAVLAYGAVLAERVERGRWATAADALAAGATVEQVGAAMDTHPDDVPVLLASWAAAQRRHGLITDERYEHVLTLLAGPVQQ